MPIPLLRPPVASGHLDDFLESGRDWHAALDPSLNGLAAAVVGRQGWDAGKGKGNADLADQRVHVVSTESMPASRRELLTQTYITFHSLQEILKAPDDPWDEDEELRLEAVRGLPPPKYVTYYHRFGLQYTEELAKHMIRLDETTPTTEAEVDELNQEIDLIKAMRDSMALAVTVYVPKDGVGMGLVVDELLDWVNRQEPKPDTEATDQLVGLAAAYEEPDLFWPYILTCTMRGHLSQASALLERMERHPNLPLGTLIAAITTLLRAAPRSHTFTTETQFLTAVDKFRSQVLNVLDRLDQAISQVVGVKNGPGKLSDDDAEFLEASLRRVLRVMSGEQSAVLETAEGWREALGSYLLWVDPSIKRNDLPHVMDIIFEEQPLDSTETLDRLHASLLTNNPITTIQDSLQLDPWLAAHLSDLLAKLDLLPHDPNVSALTLREFCILEYGESLRSDPGLWRVAVEYWSTCGKEGAGRITACLRRVVVDAEEVGAEDEVYEGEDAGTGLVKTEEMLELERRQKKTGKRPTVKEVREVCMDLGLEDEARRLSKIKARQLVKQRKYGAAVSYCVDAKDDRMVARIAERLLDEYISTGPEEFSRLVDEIPSSLLDPLAHELRPDLFTTSKPVKPTQDVPYSQFGSRLAFLARYRDMHRLYAQGEFAEVARLIVHMLVEELAPRGWWAVLLLEATYLLELEGQLVFSSNDTFELLRCLEAIVSPILTAHNRRDIYGNLSYLYRILNGKGASAHAKGRDAQEETEAALKQLDVVRDALGRHLSKCLAGGV